MQAETAGGASLLVNPQPHPHTHTRKPAAATRATPPWKQQRRHTLNSQRATPTRAEGLRVLKVVQQAAGGGHQHGDPPPQPRLLLAPVLPAVHGAAHLLGRGGSDGFVCVCVFAWKGCAFDLDGYR
jgi:hypothetical protein